MTEAACLSASGSDWTKLAATGACFFFFVLFRLASNANEPPSAFHFS